MITGLRLPPFIATLGTMSIGRGLMYWITHGWSVTIPQEQTAFLFLGQGYVGPVPVPVIVMFALMLVSGVFLARTFLGRYIYAVGGNEEAARLSGIRVNLVKVLVYTIRSNCTRGRSWGFLACWVPEGRIWRGPCSGPYPPLAVRFCSTVSR
jgi:ribose transport system permease protein